MVVVVLLLVVVVAGVVVVALGCCCCSWLLLLFPRTLCYCAPYYVFPTFSSFLLFFLFHCAKNAGFFALLFWVGVWGFGGWVSGGGGGFRGGGWGGWGGHNSVRVCVRCRFALPFFYNGCKLFFSLRQDVNFLFGAFVLLLSVLLGSCP